MIISKAEKFSHLLFIPINAIFLLAFMFAFLLIPAFSVAQTSSSQRIPKNTFNLVDKYLHSIPSENNPYSSSSNIFIDTIHEQSDLKTLLISYKESEEKRSSFLSLFGVVVSISSTCLSLVTIALFVLAYIGLNEIRSWKKIRRDILQERTQIRAIRNRIETLRREAEEWTSGLPKAIPTIIAENERKRDENAQEEYKKLNERLKLLESLGQILSPEEFLQQGNANYFAGNYTEAVKNYDRIINSDPSNMNAWLNKAFALKADENFIEAKRVLTAFRLKFPDQIIGLYALSTISALQKDRQSSLTFLKEAIEKDSAFKEIASKDLDFSYLKEDADFQSLIK